MKKYIFVITIALSLCLTACGGAETQSAAEASMEEAVKSDSSEKGALAIDGITTDEVMSETTSDGIVEKLISFGMTEDEANEGASILRQCGVPSIDICEPTDSNATIDGLVSYRGKVDNDRIYWFTVEGRRIFYVGFNGEDLYDEDKGGFLKNFNDVHIPETNIDTDTQYALIENAEAVLDNYFLYDTRYYDAWGVGREDNKYMVQCQITDGSILTDNWISGKVWYEQQDDGSFAATGVRIGDTQYEIK